MYFTAIFTNIKCKQMIKYKFDIFDKLVDKITKLMCKNLNINI